MSGAPDVSVVMAVFNGGPSLAASMDSVRAQRGVSLELIVVDDGSTDDTASVLFAAAARDERIRIVQVPHGGLTAALVAGCAAASGRYIARLDAGDLCLPTRLSRQAAFLEAHPAVKLVSCWTRYEYEDGTLLFEDRPVDDAAEATRRLRNASARERRGLSHHGSAMFRRADYVRVGGYRAEFYVAQDVDLWLRLTDDGRLGFVPEVLYVARWCAAGISGRHFAEQQKLARLAVALSRRRACGKPEADLLARAARIGPRSAGWGARRGRSRGEYFLGCMLRARAHADAAAHFERAVRTNPLNLKAWARMLTCRGGTR